MVPCRLVFDLSYLWYIGAYPISFGGLWIFTYVTCSMIDDFMSPNFWPVICLMPYWGIFPFWMRFMDLHLCRMFDDRWFHVARFLTCHTFDAILGHSTVLDEIHRSWTELSQARGFPLHPFSGVHVRSFVRPHGVTLELFGQIGYMRCHTGAYFPHLAGEAIVLSQILYSFHPSTGVYYICLTDRYSCDFLRGELSVEHDVRVWIAPLARTIQ